MNYEPLGDRVLLERTETKQKSAGGILLAFEAQEKPNEAIVIAVGPGNRTSEGVLIPMNVEVGQKVIFGANVGTEVRVEDKTYLILKEPDILCIVEE